MLAYKHYYLLVMFYIFLIKSYLPIKKINTKSIITKLKKLILIQLETTPFLFDRFFNYNKIQYSFSYNNILLLIVLLFINFIILSLFNIFYFRCLYFFILNIIFVNTKQTNISSHITGSYWGTNCFNKKL